MTITTRQPTGLPHWPTILIAGKEGTGKSRTCAVASTSEMVGRTLWVSIGETDPDMYGAIPGARFEIVEHDGTVKGVRNVMWEIAKMPPTNPPTLLVVDSMTKLWDQVKTDLQATAYRRAVAKAKKWNKPMPDEEVQITQDLWNDGKELIASITAAILTHPGPALLTARLDEVTVVDANGQPTKEKTEKVQAEKNLVYDVDCKVYIDSWSSYRIMKVKSEILKLAEDEVIQTNEWTAEGMWKRLGLEQGVSQRHLTSTEAAPDPVLEEWKEKGRNAYRRGPDIFRDFTAWAAENGAPQTFLDTLPALQDRLDRKAEELAAQRAQQEPAPEHHTPEPMDAPDEDAIPADDPLFPQEEPEPAASGHQL